METFEKIKKFLDFISEYNDEILICIGILCIIILGIFLITIMILEFRKELKKEKKNVNRSKSDSKNSRGRSC